MTLSSCSSVSFASNFSMYAFSSFSFCAFSPSMTKFSGRMSPELLLMFSPSAGFSSSASLACWGVEKRSSFSSSISRSCCSTSFSSCSPPSSITSASAMPSGARSRQRSLCSSSVRLISPETQPLPWTAALNTFAIHSSSLRRVGGGSSGTSASHPFRDRLPGTAGADGCEVSFTRLPLEVRPRRAGGGSSSAYSFRFLPGMAAAPEA
mmetsp:Transcript_9980/g.18546  ORF Transcript_9980/g.18546 Transcript_9980/m.18546 type:complete len:208 (+) Transcript_9980:390-1013(+)